MNSVRIGGNSFGRIPVVGRAELVLVDIRLVILNLS
jgi:hypothetical protein